MCECGCYGSGKTLKMAGPGKSHYLIRLLPGCEGCEVGPGVEFKLIPDTADYYDLEELEEAEKLKFVKPEFSKCEVAWINAGYNEPEFIKALKPLLIGWTPDQPTLDEFDAETIGEEIWKGILTKAPYIPKSKKKK